MNAIKAFVDTNIFLYAHSDLDIRKQKRAQELIDELSAEDRLLLSTQVVQEFYSIGSRKLKLPRPLLLESVVELLKLPLVVNGAEEIKSTLEKETRYQISFWDALILAAAESGGAGVVYTEDLNHGQKFGGVVVRNPFAE